MEEKKELKREIGFIPLVLIGVGAMVGAGVFMMTGYGVKYAGPAGFWFLMIGGALIAIMTTIGAEGIVPMWVADMDFPTPKAVTDTIVKRAAHGAFGYTGTPQFYCDAALKAFLNQKARVALDDGSWFGGGGSSFARMNIACHRSTLEEGLLRLENAVNAR